MTLISSIVLIPFLPDFYAEAKSEWNIDSTQQFLFINITYHQRDYRGLPEFAESLTFQFLSIEEQTNDLADTSIMGRRYGFYGHVVMRDVLGHSFNLIPEMESKLVIEHIDKDGRTIQGSFNAHFFLSERAGDVEYEFPEEVHFTQGKFCLQYREE